MIRCGRDVVVLLLQLLVGEAHDRRAFVTMRGSAVALWPVAANKRGQCQKDKAPQREVSVNRAAFLFETRARGHMTSVLNIR